MNKIRIEEYTDKKINEWDNFVYSSNNGTIFHTQRFLNYHFNGKFNFVSYMFYIGEELVSVLPGGYTFNETYWSPLGASYGSLVVKDITYSVSLQIVDALLDFFHKKGVKDIYLIPPPLIYSDVYNQHIEYSMLYRKFGFEYHYISHAIDLTNPLSINYNKKTRYKIRAAKNNPLLSIHEVDNFDAYYPILLENKRKHNALPTHSLEDLVKLKELFPDNIHQFNVYHNDTNSNDSTVIAGATMFACNKKVTLCFYNMLNYDYEKLYPAYLTIDYVINWAREQGFSWFDFGVSQDTTSVNPMTPSLPLIYFKEFFNSRGIFRSTYHYSFASH